MKLNEYSILARKTLKPMGNYLKDSLHMTIGLMSELSELEEAMFNKDETNIKEEIGDMFWYAVNHLSLLGEFISIEHMDTHFKHMEDLIIHHKPHSKESFENSYLSTKDEIVSLLSKLSNEDKTNYIYGKPKIDIKTRLAYILGIIDRLILISQGEVEKILTININKLKARHGDKFSDEGNTYRDLENERLILENK